MTDQEVFEIVEKVSTPGFFVTIQFVKRSPQALQGLDTFIIKKLQDIQLGLPARKFAYKEGGWILHFIFYPTDKVVDEKYAMKNYAVKSPERFK